MQYIYVDYMYSLSECFRSESNSEPLRWYIRNCSRVCPVNYFPKNFHLRCSTEFEYNSADSKP